MTSVSQLPALRRPGIVSALQHLTGTTSLRDERDARVFKQQLLRALEDPEVAAAIERAATPESDGELPDALDYQGRPLLDNVASATAVAVVSGDGDTATPGAAASPAAEAAAAEAAATAETPGAALEPSSSFRARAATQTAAKTAAWRASAAKRTRQSGRTDDAINADSVGEIVDSHYTMTAWLLSPCHDSTSDHPGYGWRTVVFTAVGMSAVIAQCLIVNALIADLIDKERWGNAADDLLTSVQGLRVGSSIIAREMQYCRSEQDWNQFIESELASGSVAGGTLCWPQEYCDTLDDGAMRMNTTLIDEANARFGYINNCWPGEGKGKAMSYMEVITDFVLTIFLGFEIYSEQQELFLQALIFHAVPRAADLSTPDGGLGDHSENHMARARYFARTWSYTVFIGFRLYLIGLVSLASAILIVSDASIAEAVLNGIALLFIVEFDNKMWRVGSWGYHSRAASDGGGFRAAYKEKLLASWNIRPLLRVQEMATFVYAIIAMALTFVVALYARHYGRLFHLNDDEQDVVSSAFSDSTVIVLWDNGVGIVSVYVVIALVLVAAATYRLHGRRRKGGMPSTKVHPHTSVTMIVLMLSATLIASTITETLLLSFAARGEPFVKADSSVVGREGTGAGSLKLQWTSVIERHDNSTWADTMLLYACGHFVSMVVLLLVGERARGVGVSTGFYLVAGLLSAGFVALFFIVEIWPILYGTHPPASCVALPLRLLLRFLAHRPDIARCCAKHVALPSMPPSPPAGLRRAI